MSAERSLAVLSLPSTVFPRTQFAPFVVCSQKTCSQRAEAQLASAGAVQARFPPLCPRTHTPAYVRVCSNPRARCQSFWVFLPSSRALIDAPRRHGRTQEDAGEHSPALAVTGICFSYRKGAHGERQNKCQDERVASHARSPLFHLRSTQ